MLRRTNMNVAAICIYINLLCDGEILEFAVKLSLF